MKYGVFEKKEMEKKELESLGPSHISSQKKLVVKNMLKNSWIQSFYFLLFSHSKTFNKTQANLCIYENELWICNILFKKSVNPMFKFDLYFDIWLLFDYLLSVIFINLKKVINYVCVLFIFDLWHLFLISLFIKPRFTFILVLRIFSILQSQIRMVMELSLRPDSVTNLESFLATSRYKQLAESTMSFNRRLNEERKMRIPYIDGQTGVAQKHYPDQQRSARERMPGLTRGQVYSYPQVTPRQCHPHTVINVIIRSDSGGSGDTSTSSTSCCPSTSDTSQSRSLTLEWSGSAWSWSRGPARTATAATITAVRRCYHYIK